jgi:hypothetical protein
MVHHGLKKREEITDYEAVSYQRVIKEVHNALRERKVTRLRPVIFRLFIRPMSRSFRPGILMTMPPAYVPLSPSLRLSYTEHPIGICQCLDHNHQSLVFSAVLTASLAT